MIFHLTHNIHGKCYFTVILICISPTSKKYFMFWKSNAWQRCEKQALINRLPGGKTGTTSVEDKLKATYQNCKCIYLWPSLPFLWIYVQRDLHMLMSVIVCNQKIKTGRKLNVHQWGNGSKGLVHSQNTIVKRQVTCNGMEHSLKT